MGIRRILFLAAVLAPAVAHAGPDSEVASSFDDDDPFDLHVTLDYGYELHRGAVMREALRSDLGAGDPIPVEKDLYYRSSRHVITPRAELAIFHDLAITMALPIVVIDQRTLELDQRDTPCSFVTPRTCIDRASSSTIADGLLPMSGFDADDPATSFPGDGSLIFRGPDRKGLDQFHLGMVVAPMNQLRDDTKPTWKLGAELRLAVGKVAELDGDDPGGNTGVGSGVHEVRVYSSIARKIGWAEPYFEAWWQAPIKSTSKSLFQDVGFGAQSIGKQQEAGTRFGFEAIAVDKGPDRQRVSLDLSARVLAHFEGRNYTPMWEVFALAGDAERGGPLILDASPTQAGMQALSHPGISNVENYLEMGGRAALRADLGPLVHVAALFEVSNETRHVITFADAGVDLETCSGGETSDCEPTSNDVVNPGTEEVNPVHAPTIDLVGHRYVLDSAVNLTMGVEARILF